MKKLLLNLNELPFGPQQVSVVGGHFDLIHPGHVRFLIECKRLSNGPLVVLVANDEASRKKKLGRPIMSEKDRAEMLVALECVDYVYIFPTEILEMPSIIKSFSPQKVFFSIDPHPSSFTESLKKLLKEQFSEIEVIDIPRQRSDISTSEIIDRIISTNAVRSPETVVLKNNKEIQAYLTDLSKKSKQDYQVGAILLDEQTGEVLSEGFNVVAEVDNKLVIHRNENTPEQKMNRPRALHAEVTAICSFLTNENISLKNATLYSTIEPCAGCAQLIAQLNIKKVRYFEEFDNNFGTLILEKAGIDTRKI